MRTAAIGTVTGAEAGTTPVIVPATPAIALKGLKHNKRLVIGKLTKTRG
jgi:hypothetical protein